MNIFVTSTTVVAYILNLSLKS